MKIHLYFEPGKGHQQKHLEALAKGMQRVGDTARAASTWDTADVLVVWGSAPKPPWHEGPMLHLEAGFINGESGDYVRDRLRYCSLGWNGVAGLADPLPECPADRWEASGVEWPGPQEVDAGAPVLVCKQHPNDAAAQGADWPRIIAACESFGEVRVREHPVVQRRSGRRVVPLAAELEAVALVVTYSSTSAVEAILAGLPTVALSDRSIAHGIAASSLLEPWTEWGQNLDLVEPWLHQLAYRQWTLAELADGSAWEFFKSCASDQ